MRVGGKTALLFDYDGTLSPVDAPRERAYPPPELARVLEKLSERYIVGVVTSKDYWFMRGRAGFASVLGLVSGLEAILGPYVFTVREAVEGAGEGVEALRGRASGAGCLVFEEKRSITGRLLGLCLDWRQCGSKPAVVDELLAELRARGLAVLEYRGHPFVDAYVARPDKSRVLELVRKVAGADSIIYFGDSENDLEAFRAADVRVLVKHRYNEHLASAMDFNFVVEYERLARWLSSEFL